MRRLDGIPGSINLSLSKLREMLKHSEAWRAAESMGWQRVRHDNSSNVQTSAERWPAGSRDSEILLNRALESSVNANSF